MGGVCLFKMNLGNRESKMKLSPAQTKYMCISLSIQKGSPFYGRWANHKINEEDSACNARL